MDNTIQKPKNKYDISFGYIVKICLPLLIICALTAGLVSVVNLLTKDKITENLNADKKTAIQTIFGDRATFEAETNEDDADFELFKVSDGSDICGFCVSLNSAGFGGDISMMVGFDKDGTLKKVKIISMSETPGLGSKTGDDAFLSGFDGKTAPLAVGKGDADKNIDAVAGATISSKAVTEGVNEAYRILASSGLLGEGGNR